jgi:two-component system chemotaxis sensor kinase CheA
MDELLKDFLVEAGEQIEAVSAQLVRFERDPGDTRVIANIYRLVHSIKGTCGFLDLPRLEALAHAAEALIGRLRDGAPAAPDSVSLVLRAVDRIKQIVVGIEAAAAEPAGDDSKLIAALVSRASGVRLRQPEAEVWEAPELIRPALAAVPGVNPPAPEPRSETVRVSVSTLERLMALVSELVLARNQLVDRARGVEHDAFEQPLQRLTSVTTELQHGVMKARMQPIGRLFSSLPRIVRDLSAELGKKIEVTASGGDTELDRQLVAIVRDPLTQLIRNAVAHGVETPERRRAAGKPETGAIGVRAYQDAGSIVVEVCDDGAGLDISAIRAKAVARGLAREAEVACMSDAEAARFIFAPGFSTAAEVTALSGRGVGMDVVRENIESIGGAASVVSRPGQGAAFLLKIPLTLAIAPALIAQSAGERFALPQDGVVEAHELGQHGARLETTQGAPVLICHRGVIPARDLRDILKIGPAPQERPAAAYAVVLKVGTALFCVLVEEIVEVLDIVVKPLPAKLARIGMYSGVTVLGDGAALLILDASGLARSFGIEKSDGLRAFEGPAPALARPGCVVLFRCGDRRLRAAPAALVARVDRIRACDMRRVGGERTARLGGRLVPLLDARALRWGESAFEHADADLALPVLVLGEGARMAGLVVDEIVDVVEAELTVELSSCVPTGGEPLAPGVAELGAASLGGEVVEVIDVAALLRSAPLAAPEEGGDVLVADDSPFIRDMIAAGLRAAGFSPRLAADAREAGAALAEARSWRAILLDCDLIDEDGAPFARTVLDALGEQAPPIIGLTPHPTAPARRRAEEAGLACLVGTFDRPGLLRALGEARPGPRALEREAAA